MLFGVISDTHGLLRPSAMRALEGVDQIIHAGDVGPREILDTLATLAPVTVVRGNVDTGPECDAWPESAVVEGAGRHIYLIHNRSHLDLDLQTAGMDGLIFGHSHRPEIVREGPLLYLNPGSAGPRRFKLPISLALLRVDSDGWHPELVELEE